MTVLAIAAVVALGLGVLALAARWRRARRPPEQRVSDDWLRTHHGGR